MARISFDTGQVEALSADLSAAPGRVQTRMSRSVRGTAKDVQAAAERFVPVLTGTLRASIRTEMVGPLEAEVSANTDYAIYVEQGTSKMAPEPFMAPAASMRSGRLERDAGDAVEDIL